MATTTLNRAGFLCILMCLGCMVWHASRLDEDVRGVPPAGINDEHDQRSYSASGTTEDFKFIYSEDELFKVIREIRSKNCQLLSKEYPLNWTCETIEKCSNRTKGKTEIERPQGCEKHVPKCILIGVAKSGTIEVLNFLMMNHFILNKREIHLGKYFNDKASYENGIDWYRDTMPFSMPDQITMEKGNYFFDMLASARIHAMDPNIKLLLMIRNPVDRLFSSFTFRMSAEETFDKLDKLSNRTDRTDDDVECGGKPRYKMYDQSFERYLQFFNRDQIHVVDFEKFKYDLYGTLRGIESFLGIPHVIQKDDLVFNGEKGFFCVRAPGKQYAACFGSDRGRKGISNNFEEYRAPLMKCFKPFSERFFKLIGERFNWS